MPSDIPRPIDPVAVVAAEEQMLTPRNEKRMLKVWHTAFPDAKADVTNRLTECDQVLTEVTFHGTHTGPLAGAMGITPPTGKRVDLSMAIVNWFRNGKIQRERAYFDLAGLMQQLGIASTRSWR